MNTLTIILFSTSLKVRFTLCEQVVYIHTLRSKQYLHFIEEESPSSGSSETLQDTNQISHAHKLFRQQQPLTVETSSERLVSAVSQLAHA